MELHGKFGKNADLSTSIGLSETGDQFWNLTPAELIEDCIILGEGMLTDTGALAIETGEFTGRSPKDRFIVRDELTENAVWWGNVNIGFEPAKFDALYERMKAHLAEQDIYVRDVYACADPTYRMNIRVVAELPWSSLFAHNMFLRLGPTEIEDFLPEWHIVCAPSFHADHRWYAPA
jgi:phosphoenolpyruvate carboxykinase (ATP)